MSEDGRRNGDRGVAALLRERKARREATDREDGIVVARHGVVGAGGGRENTERREKEHAAAARGEKGIHALRSTRNGTGVAGPFSRRSRGSMPWRFSISFSVVGFRPRSSAARFCTPPA